MVGSVQHGLHVAEHDLQPSRVFGLGGGLIAGLEHNMRMSLSLIACISPSAARLVLPWLSGYKARKQVVSGSLVLSNTVSVRSEHWCRHVEHRHCDYPTLCGREKSSP